MKFKYEEFVSKESKVCYPSFNIIVINPKTKLTVLPYKVLIDSGASICLFHSWVAEKIGLDIKKGSERNYVGVNGQKMKCYIHNLKIVFGGYSTDLDVGFSSNMRSWFGLLGQQSFFEKHRVCFDLPKKDFEITPKIR